MKNFIKDKDTVLKYILSKNLIGGLNMNKTMQDAVVSHNIEKTKRFIDLYLMDIIKKSGESLEGNIFTLDQSTDYTSIYMGKVTNIAKLAINLKSDKLFINVLEIGFNSGFSSLLMLISNPLIKLTCYDLGEHKYTLPCYNKLKEVFGNRINLIIGDSTKTLPKATGEYDLIHIDGGHSVEVATQDIINSYKLSKKGTIFIFDDYDFGHLHGLWDSYVKKYLLKNINFEIDNHGLHDIKVRDS